MTVAELIELLSEFNPNMRVLKSEDDEGNSFSFVGSISSNAVDVEEMYAVHPDDEWEYDELERMVVLW